MDIFKVLKDDDKLKLIYILYHREYCVCELETILELKQNTLSNKLKALREHQIIELTKNKNWHYYKLTGEFRDNNQLLLDYILANYVYELPEFVECRIGEK